MSPVVSLADEGYRQFGPLPAAAGGQTATQIAEVASKCADWPSAPGSAGGRAGMAGGSSPALKSSMSSTAPLT